MSPSGTVSMTTTDLMTDLNCRTIVMQISARDICITSPISALVLAQFLVLTGKLHFVARVQFESSPGPAGRGPGSAKATPRKARRL